MYSEKVKFEFNKEVSHSKRLEFMNELLEELENQEDYISKSKKLDSGGIHYKIKHSGAVIISSWFPPSTNIVRKFVETGKKSNVLR